MEALASGGLAHALTTDFVLDETLTLLKTRGGNPETIIKAIRRGIEEEIQARQVVRQAVGRDEATEASEEYVTSLEAEMLEAAENLEFERAAALRDKIVALRAARGDGRARPAASPQAQSARRKAKGGRKRQ